MINNVSLYIYEKRKDLRGIITKINTHVRISTKMNVSRAKM